MSKQVMTTAAEEKLRYLLARIGPNPTPHNVDIVARALYFFGKFDGIMASIEDLKFASAAVSKSSESQA